jgi:hypothetical protein
LGFARELGGHRGEGVRRGVFELANANRFNVRHIDRTTKPMYKWIMRANPGGEIAASEVIGRDEFIRHLWDVLDRQSVMLVAERRFGKTTVIKKMHADPPTGWTVLWRDVEGCSSPDEFTERVCGLIHPLLGSKARALSRLREMVTAAGGMELAGVIKLPNLAAGHWKTVLDHAFNCLADAADGKVLFGFDELPYMLSNIQRRCGADQAMDVLDMLRHLRQTHGRRFPMIYSGSIGIHHVTRDLREHGHANPALNDLQTVELPPLSEDGAIELGRRLIAGEELECDDPAALAACVGALVDRVPYYMHGVFKGLKLRGPRATPEIAQEVTAEALVGAHDPWNLRHYETRLRSYYGETDGRVAAGILDELASSDAPIGAREIHRVLSSTESPGRDLEGIRDLLTRLETDHYVRRNVADGKYEFRFSLIRRWWRMARDLA